MRDFLKMVAAQGPIAADGRNGYSVAGKPVDRGQAHQAIASGYVRWDFDQQAHVLTDAGKAKVAA